MAINDSFDYQVNRLGLEDFGVHTCTIPSPFSYKEQVKLLLPSDIPAINQVTEQQFAEDIAIKIWRIADETKGKMLVLFTAYDMLKTVFQHVKDLNQDQTLQTIGQGITSGSRAKLMKSFKQYEHAILFGTSSFWEGVDLPGNELQNLVIVRLPFTPPDQLAASSAGTGKGGGTKPFYGHIFAASDHSF